MESQNHSISAFPTPWKSKITQFLRFQPLGKSKSPIFCVSNPLESQNHPVFCASNPLEKQKCPIFAFRPRPKSRKPEKQAFGHGRRTKYRKNRLSATADERKTQKPGFRPRPKDEKQKKTAFPLISKASQPHFSLKKYKKNLYNKV